MTIKLVPLAQAYPGSGYEKGKRRARQFEYAGIEFHKACGLLREHKTRDQDWTWLIYVELPLMHQTLELLVKAARRSLTTPLIRERGGTTGS